MKNPLSLLLLIATALAAAAAEPRVIEITANDTMKFSVTSIEAKPGEQLKVVLTNAGTLPKQIMAHNWVLLQTGSDALAFATTAISAKDTNYIPASLQSEIVAHIDLQGPHESGSVTFTVPDKPGNYPFLCSFPAHYQVGMQGTLVVK